jgi:hypothetical protein
MATVSTFTTLSLAAAEADDKGIARANLRRELDVEAFALNLHRADRDDIPLIAEHDETEPAFDGHEEVFLVTAGHAVFTVDGEEVDAPAGTVVFVRDPAARRSAHAKTAGTTVVCAGGRRGTAWRPTPAEAMREFWPLHQAGDYEGSQAVLREASAEYPGNPLALYNLACCAARLGDREGAFTLLRAAVDAHQRFAVHARDDEDLESLRDDPRFAALVSS